MFAYSFERLFGAWHSPIRPGFVHMQNPDWSGEFGQLFVADDEAIHVLCSVDCEGTGELRGTYAQLRRYAMPLRLKPDTRCPHISRQAFPEWSTVIVLCTWSAMHMDSPRAKGQIVHISEFFWLWSSVQRVQIMLLCCCIGMRCVCHFPCLRDASICVWRGDI